MISRIFSRTAYSALVMAGVVVLVFILFQGFGDPARLIVGQRADAATLDNIRKELYLDQPKWKQFLLYLNDISPISVYSKQELDMRSIRYIGIGGNTKLVLKFPYLRRSYQTRKEVWSMLMVALPGTIILAFAAMLLAAVVGIFLGVTAAIKKDSWIDHAAIFFSTLGISAPSFFMSIIIAYVFGFVLSAYTGLHMTGSLFDTDPFYGRQLELKNLILPAVTLGIRPLSIITQLTRGSMLDTLNQDFIRTAYAKGLSKQRVVWKHALPNALNPVITAITGWFAELLAGAFFVEYIFGWNGIGKLTVDALAKLDFPVVMGSVLVTAFFFIVVNMLADWLYRLFDPRVQ
ncbi:MAG TPA: ABC transporter permease [Puia sp.]|nr:ABC transporter permease [Puia sp.]